MRYIPGHTFKVTTTQLTGNIKNKFTPGEIYSINAINRCKDGKINYVFTKGGELVELKFSSSREADTAIEYITTGKISEHKDYYERDRSD